MLAGGLALGVAGGAADAPFTPATDVAGRWDCTPVRI